MIVAQILAVTFALGMLYTTYLHFRRSDYSKGIALLWMVLWTGLGVLSIMAPHLQVLVEKIKFKRLLDVVMVVGLAIFAFVTFINFAALSRLERKLEQFVRKDALADLDVEDKPVDAATHKLDAEDKK